MLPLINPRVLEGMKTSLFPRLALLAGVLSLTGATALLAQDETSSSTTTTTTAAHHHGGGLTADQWAELKKDREAVYTDNPDLKTEEESLHQQMKAHMDKVDAAIVAKDPAIAPVLAKMKEGHHHGPPPDQQ